MAQISIEGVSKVYGDGTEAVKSATLSVPDGALCVLVGPSGCGKTTLLRMVAGLESITRGNVRIGDRVVNNLPPKHRDIAMVFQNYALYPHMSVYQNIGFSLQMRKESRQVVDARVRGAAQTLGLEDYLAKQPRLLSGGQRQRVAMGRAMVREPRALLMDEPLSNLDAKLRVQMRTEIGRRQRELGVTTLYVTHDQTEAMTLGDQVAVLRKGVIQQVAPPQVLFDQPANVFVAGFIGSPPMNLLEGSLRRDGDRLTLALGPTVVPLPPPVLTYWTQLRTRPPGPVIVGIRPEDVTDAEFRPDLATRLPAQVEVKELLGRVVQIHCSVPVTPVDTEQTRELARDADGQAPADGSRQRTPESQASIVASADARTKAAEGHRLELALDPATFYFFDTRTGDSLQ